MNKYLKYLSLILVCLGNDTAGMGYRSDSKPIATIKIATYDTKPLTPTLGHPQTSVVGDRPYKSWENTSNGMRADIHRTPRVQPQHANDMQMQQANQAANKIDPQELYTKAKDLFPLKPGKVSDQDSSKLRMIFATGNKKRLAQARRYISNQAPGAILQFFASFITDKKTEEANQCYQLAEQVEHLSALYTTQLLFLVMNGDLNAAEAAAYTIATRTMSAHSMRHIDFNAAAAAKEILESRPDHQNKIKAQRLTREKQVNYNVRKHALQALNVSADRATFADNLNKIVDTVYDNAQALDYEIHPEIGAQINDSLDLLATTDNVHEFMFSLATIDHLLCDTQKQLAREKGVYRSNALEHTSELLVRAVHKYWQDLSPTETEVSLVCDLAKYISDVTTGTHYLSQEVINQRVQQFWDMINSISLRNISKLTAEDVVDGAMYIAARITWFTGIDKGIKVAKNLKHAGQLGKHAAAFAGKLLDKFNVVIGAHPAIITADGAVVVQASAAEAGYAVAIASYFKDKFWGSDNDQIKNVDQLLKREGDVVETTRNTLQAANMKEVFNKTDFGKKLKDCSQKTKYIDAKTNSQIYEVTKDMPEYGLKKGDKFYLDKYHKDHLEVFRNNKGETILNLDGSMYHNANKALSRRLKIK